MCELSFPADVLLDTTASMEGSAVAKPVGAGGSPISSDATAVDYTHGAAATPPPLPLQEAYWNFTVWSLKFRALKMGSGLARTVGELARLFRRIGTFQTLPLPYDADARGPATWDGLPAVLLPRLRINRGLTWAKLEGGGGEDDEVGATEGQAEGHGNGAAEGAATDDIFPSSWRSSLRDAWREHMHSDAAADEEAEESTSRRRQAWPSDPRFRSQPGWKRLDGAASSRLDPKPNW